MTSRLFCKVHCEAVGVTPSLEWFQQGNCCSRVYLYVNNIDTILVVVFIAVALYSLHRSSVPDNVACSIAVSVFVETLDKCFENVCELDLIFHVDKVHNILAEMVMGGMVLETNMNEIVTQIDAQNKLEKSEVRLENALVSEGSEHARELFMPDSVAFTAGLAGAPARAVSAVKNMNLPEIPRNINIGDISIKVPNLPSFK
ncbi:hypothetical protein U0070_024662 [Myodes glareolus]|uniref:AP complex mu/sigma subunit domain-containing protein n=1 Tax=Myodes glareolus TaxID=447135 RepID=A0AAW0JYR0_MYOGA